MSATRTITHNDLLDAMVKARSQVDFGSPKQYAAATWAALPPTPQSASAEALREALIGLLRQVDPQSRARGSAVSQETFSQSMGVAIDRAVAALATSAAAGEGGAE